MIMEFGKGKIAVCTIAYGLRGKLPTALVLENDQGNGDIGGNIKGMPPKICVHDDMDSVIQSNLDIVMKFQNSESVQVVINALEKIKNSFTNPRFKQKYLDMMNDSIKYGKKMIKYSQVQMWGWECACGEWNEEEEDPRDTEELVCNDCEKTFTEFEEE